MPRNREIRFAYNKAYAQAQKVLPEGSAQLAGSAAGFEFVFVPGYLYKRHSITGADLAAPRAALKRTGLAQHFIERVEDGAIEANAEIVAAGILVSVSKSGPEVASALTRLGAGGTNSVAAWVNIAGALQGSPLADEILLQLEELVGKVDVAGVESLLAANSWHGAQPQALQRFSNPATYTRDQLPRGPAHGQRLVAGAQRFRATARAWTE